MAKTKLTPAEKSAKRAEKQATIAKLKSDVLSLKAEFEIVRIITYDWKWFSEERYQDLKAVVEGLGGLMYDNPLWADSDQYSFIITKKVMTKADLKRFKEFSDEWCDLSDEVGSDLCLEPLFN